jgi:3-oxoacyl-[acyl-carrier-protein] synthase II/nodulation protein E
MQRVVITGLGCITPIGATPEALWQSLESGQSGILSFADQDPSLKFKQAGQILDLDTTTLTNTQLQSTERCSQLALLASRQAALQSQLTQHHPADKIAILLGCSTNGRQAEEPETARVYTQNARVHPLTIARSMASNGVSQVAIDQRITGPALTISTACASGAHAIGMAFHMIRSGMVAAALAGGHEAPLTKGFLRAWDSMRVVSPTSCRPFSADRDGMTLAEGAAVLSLETLASARARNAPIYAEILGFGMATDAHHITQPRPEGPAQAILAALRDAAATLSGTDQPDTAQSLLEEVGYINAHGTATQTNDSVESAAIHQAFGGRAPRIPISGTKGFHGHSLGASAAIETLITALALHHRRLPYTLGTANVDPAIDLDLILNAPRELPGKGPVVALANSLAFGGLNAILCLRTFPN